MNKCIVLFVEGQTEVEFYKRIIQNEEVKEKLKPLFDELDFKFF